MAPTSVFLPGKSHGQRSLLGCNAWGREELNMTSSLAHMHETNRKAFQLLPWNQCLAQSKKTAHNNE